MVKHLKLKDVVIVIPIHKASLSEFELLALHRVHEVLGRYDVVFFAPPSLDVSYYKGLYPNIAVTVFDPQYFGSAKRHCKLLLSATFYKRFRQYQYMLMYHLDAFVFEDRLDEWVKAGYDYVGSPWFTSFATSHHEGHLYAVGNGGFSLRNIQSFLKVIYAYKIIQSPSEIMGSVKKINIANRFEKAVVVLRMMFGYKNNSRYMIENYSRNEDEFWGVYAPRYFPWFKVPDVNTALKFSFECDPAYCFAQNNNELPFGCHAWDKNDLDFWRPYILEGNQQGLTTKTRSRS